MVKVSGVLTIVAHAGLVDFANGLEELFTRVGVYATAVRDFQWAGQRMSNAF